MSVRLILGKAGPRNLAFELSQLAELGAMLHLLAEPQHHPHELELVTRLQAEIPPELGRECAELSPLWGSYRLRLLFPLSLATPRTLSDELAEIKSLPIDDFVELTAFAARGGNSGESLRHVLSDRQAQHRVVDRARSRGRGAETIAEALFADPEAFRSRLLGVLEGVSDFALSTVWEQRAAALRMDAAARRDLATTKGTAAALLSLSRSIQPADSESVVIDKIHHGVVDVGRQPLLVVPTSLGWPHLLVKHERGWPAVLQYPLKAEERSDSASLALLQLRLSVLADPVRLRVCRAVAREPRTTADLAQAWGISSSQISRHFRALREAGLINGFRHGRFVAYQLDAAALARLGADLIVALLR